MSETEEPTGTKRYSHLFINLTVLGVMTLSLYSSILQTVMFCFYGGLTALMVYFQGKDFKKNIHEPLFLIFYPIKIAVVIGIVVTFFLPETAYPVTLALIGLQGLQTLTDIYHKHLKREVDSI